MGLQEQWKFLLVRFETLDLSKEDESPAYTSPGNVSQSSKGQEKPVKRTIRRKNIQPDHIGARICV